MEWRYIMTIALATTYLHTKLKHHCVKRHIAMNNEESANVTTLLIIKQDQLSGLTCSVTLNKIKHQTQLLRELLLCHSSTNEVNINHNFSRNVLDNTLKHIMSVNLTRSENEANYYSSQ